MRKKKWRVIARHSHLSSFNPRAASAMFAALRKYDGFSKIQDDVRVKTSYGAAGAPR
jgi:hypothetical protein